MDDLLQQFCGMTGAEPALALSFLEANNWELVNAINLYIEIARSMNDIPPEMYENDDKRTKTLPKLDVQPSNIQSTNVFDMYPNYQMTTTEGEDPNLKKLKTLADLFRPPVDLIERGPFETVKNIAKRRKKWILVNVQAVSEFDCHKMNRDTWADSAVKSVVRANFVLWQVLKTSAEGMWYSRLYPVNLVPHLSIIDPHTGEQLDIAEGFMEPKDLVARLLSFSETNLLDTTSMPELSLQDLDAAQLATAVAASFEKGSTLHTTSTTQTSTHLMESTPKLAESTFITPTSTITPNITPISPFSRLLQWLARLCG